VPANLRPLLIGLIYGWHGKYKSWKEAAEDSTGYDSPEILRKVISSAEAVLRGEALFERDTVLFARQEFSFPLVSFLMTIASENKGKLTVLDFGGSLGSLYHQHKLLLDRIPDLKWNIVEQPDIVEAGISRFTSDRLRFFHSIEESSRFSVPDVLILSSVLQYLEDPYGFIRNIKLNKIKYIIIDRTPFVPGEERLTVQKVPPWIYKASYPCWFFNKDKFLGAFSPDYLRIAEFQALDRSNIRSEFKGFLLRIKT